MPAFVRVGFCIVPTQGLRCVMLEKDATCDEPAFLVLHYAAEQEPLKVRIDAKTVDATLDALLAVMNDAPPLPPPAPAALRTALTFTPATWGPVKDEMKTREGPVASWQNKI